MIHFPTAYAEDAGDRSSSKWHTLSQHIDNPRLDLIHGAASANCSLSLDTVQLANYSHFIGWSPNASRKISILYGSFIFIKVADSSDDFLRLTQFQPKVSEDVC